MTEVSPGRFDAAVHPEWTIAGKPNGGYLLAILGRAAAAVGPHEHVIAASAHYLHSPDPGPVTVVAEILRAGRSASQVRTRMLQDGTACVEALVTTSRLDPDSKPYWDAGVPARSGAVAGHRAAAAVDEPGRHQGRDHGPGRPAARAGLAGLRRRPPVRPR